MNYRKFGPLLWLAHQRTHHPDIAFGCWRLCLNGVQFFAGRYALTIHWPAEWSKGRRNAA